MRVFSLVLALLTVAGCGPAKGALVDEGTTADTDTDPTGEADPDADPDPDPQPDPDPIATWTGERFFDVGGQWGPTCEDTIHESGVDITDDAAYADAVAACPICDYVFRIEVQEEAICLDVSEWLADGIAMSSPTFRGMALGNNDTAVLFNIYEDDSGDFQREELADASMNGLELEYEYSGSYWGAPYTVEGTVTLTDVE